MKAEAESLGEVVGMNQEKNKLAYGRVEAVVDHMIELYEQAEKSIRTGRNHHEVIQGLNQQLLALRPLKNVREHFLHYYRKLSNLVRKLQNGSKTTNPALSGPSRRKDSLTNGNEHVNQLNIEKFNSFFDKFINQEPEQKALQKLIVQHYLREGKWECAKVWSQTAQEIDPNNLFTECRKLKEKIVGGQFEEAIQWCQSESLFETRANLLEYQLMKTHIVALLEKGEPTTALEYFAKRLQKFEPCCRLDIEKLMGYIMFREKSYWGEQLKGMSELFLFCSDRYAGFSCSKERRTNLAQCFVKEFLKQNNLSQFDVVKIVFTCSNKISEEYQRLMSLTWQGEGKEEKKYEGSLPFSIRLEKEYQYHSLFLCPVTKEVHSSGEASVLLSCGHLISQPAQDRIVLESRSRRRVRCPICQKQIHPQDSISVEF